MTASSVFSLRRNDLKGAAEFLDAHWGKLRGSDLRTLLMLQDDATKLIRLVTSLRAAHHGTDPTYDESKDPRNRVDPRPEKLRKKQAAADDAKDDAAAKEPPGTATWFRAINTKNQRLVWVTRERYKKHPGKYRMPKPDEKHLAKRPKPPEPEPKKKVEPEEPPGTATWFRALHVGKNKVVWVTRERFKKHPGKYQLLKKPEKKLKPEKGKPPKPEKPPKPPEPEPKKKAR